jgi:hypothetical protein
VSHPTLEKAWFMNKYQPSVRNNFEGKKFKSVKFHFAKNLYDPDVMRETMNSHFMKIEKDLEYWWNKVDCDSVEISHNQLSGRRSQYYSWFIWSAYNANLLFPRVLEARTTLTHAAAMIEWGLGHAIIPE